MRAASIKRILTKGFIFARKYLPISLAVISAGCAVGAVVTAIQDAEKVSEEDNKKEQTAIEKVKYYGKKYWKPIIFCAGSVTAVGFSAFIFAKRQKQLTISLEESSRLLSKYAKAATVTAGVEGTRLLNRMQENVHIPESESEDDGKKLFWDPVFQRWFRTYETSFLTAAYQTSCNFSMTGAETYVDFCHKMDVDPPTDRLGNPIYGWGWSADDEWVSSWCEMSGYIGIGYSGPYQTDDGLEYYVVSYDQEPLYYEDLDVPWRV